MFAKTCIADPGAFWMRLDSPAAKEPCRIRCCYFQEGSQTVCGQEAFEAYWKTETGKIVYPVNQGEMLKNVRPVFQELLKESSMNSYLLKPNLLVILPQDIQESEKEIWKNIAFEAGFRKVLFKNSMDLLACSWGLVIHAGHSCTEMAVYADGVQKAYRKLIFSGQQIDEAIQTWVASAYRALLFQEDACALRKAASQAFWKGKNPRLSCTVLDQRGQYVRIEFPADSLWPFMAQVYKQIVLWAKSLVSELGLEAMDRVLEQPVYLSGGLAQSFGLRQMLEQQMAVEVEIAQDPEEIIIRKARESLSWL